MTELQRHIMICAKHEPGQWTTWGIAADVSVSPSTVYAAVAKLKARGKVETRDVVWFDPEEYPRPAERTTCEEAERAWAVLPEVVALPGNMATNMRLASGLSQRKCERLLRKWRDDGIVGRRVGLYAVEAT